ncbi:hypothetical protein CTI14_38085 [Methylobacterium radiotolerans]|nr:hypothetical protein CTI14_38085 [Methylobacterium radiotolerans]
MTDDAWISHRTAAALQGMFLPPWVDDHDMIHLSRPAHLARVRRAGVVGHHTRIRPGELHHVEGLLMTTPARTWLGVSPSSWGRSSASHWATSSSASQARA